PKTNRPPARRSGRIRSGPESARERCHITHRKRIRPTPILNVPIGAARPRKGSVTRRSSSMPPARGRASRRCCGQNPRPRCGAHLYQSIWAERPPCQRAALAPSAAAAVLLEARHDLHEIAGAMAVVELPDEDLAPGVAAGSRRARQAEDVGAVREPSTGARLDRGCPHLLEGDHVED